MSRDQEQIQREIETSRAQLAGTLDQLVERTSPKRLAGVAQDRVTTVAVSPPGLAVLGAVGLLVALRLARRARRARKARKAPLTALG